MGYDSPEEFLNKFCARRFETLTAEQMAFARDITTSVELTASPGTGKTHTCIYALWCAELYHQIPGDKIYALSFTNNATAELAVRYREVAKSKLSNSTLETTIHFETLHSMFKSILADNYQRLDMDGVHVENVNYQELSQLIKSVADELNVEVNEEKIPKAIRLIGVLNNRLAFDKNAIVNNKDFKELGMSYESFNFIRHFIHGNCIRTGTVFVSDILMYTLELLLKCPDIQEKEKQKHRIILVDEAQDLSLLQLMLLHCMTDCLVLVGDPKQQIYAFTGACQEVFVRYKELYPNARSLQLTQSFRCKSEIADYATKLIRPNRIPGSDDFRGIGPGGDVIKTSGFDYKHLLDEIKEEFVSNHNKFKVNRMFLFRNNDLGMEIIEEIYQRGMPFRTRNYPGAPEMPVIKELCEIMELCLNPGTPSNAAAFKYLIPEFSKYPNWSQIPLAKISRQTGKDMFSINYSFTNPALGDSAMDMLVELREMLLAGRTCKDVFNRVYDMFYQRYLQYQERYLPNKPSFYTSMVSPLIRNKTYMRFRKDEVEKASLSKQYNSRNEGIRCYTFHGSKGLEAEEVYLVNTDEGYIPNLSKIKKMQQYNDSMGVAREIRNERHLVYVAATRAKSKLCVTYANELAHLFDDEASNDWSSYDALYTESGVTSEDIELFKEFITEED